MSRFHSRSMIMLGLISFAVFISVTYDILEIPIFTGRCKAENIPNYIYSASKYKSYHRRINFVYSAERRTPNPQGWEQYDGSPYNPERGYGWLRDLSKSGRDRGADAAIVLRGGYRTTPKELSRLELANWQGTHQENQLLVFRVDLPDGWYRVTCTSVDPGSGPLPLVDRRTFKCRANDAVFAGAQYGSPLLVKGNELVEGANIVEAINGHLRIAIGDPSYGGWIWKYKGPWYKGWIDWWGHDYQYATDWYKRISRTVDPGYHSLRLNSLEIIGVGPRDHSSPVIFRDFFDRDNSLNINEGVCKSDEWFKVQLHSNMPARINSVLYQASLRLSGSENNANLIGLLQRKISAPKGIIRYMTRVSLFMGEGSQIYSGSQEAGILLLCEPSNATEFNATFVGVAFYSYRSDTGGWVIYRVGNGKEDYIINQEIPDTDLPFRIREGEYELVVEHDVERNMITGILVNGIDITEFVDKEKRKQRISEGYFGIRSMINNQGSLAKQEQYYWYYKVEGVN